MKPLLSGRAIVASAVVSCVASTVSSAHADNPIVQTNYTADPAPVVHEGTVYLYTSHDEDVTVDNFFTMNDWRLYTSTDIVNWTDRGSPLSYRDFSWSSGDAWAPHVIPRNGKWYFYVPITQNSGSPAIGVAVSDHPEGPFEDPLGRPLVADDWGDIDPSVFIDDDGQAYLYWGNPDLKYVLLNEDMISYSGDAVHVPMTTQSFGARNGDAERPTLYEEGPWFYRRADTYYLVYPAGGIPEYIAYSTSPSPTGPFTYQGVIMPTEGASFTNHPGVIDFQGRSFFFYHNGALPGGGGFKRSVCVEEFEYGADGGIPTITMTQQGASQVAPLNPYVQVEAETIAWQEGIETEECSEGGMNVSQIDGGDSIKVKGVDFGTGALSFEARVSSDSEGGNIELHLDAATGELIGTCAVEGTGGWQEWITVSCDVSDVQGTHDLYLVFTGAGGPRFNLNWWRFTSIDPVLEVPTDMPTDVGEGEPSTTDDEMEDPDQEDTAGNDGTGSDVVAPPSTEPTPPTADDPVPVATGAGAPAGDEPPTGNSGAMGGGPELAMPGAATANTGGMAVGNMPAATGTQPLGGPASAGTAALPQAQNMAPPAAGTSDAPGTNTSDGCALSGRAPRPRSGAAGFLVLVLLGVCRVFARRSDGSRRHSLVR